MWGPARGCGKTELLLADPIAMWMYTLGLRLVSSDSSCVLAGEVSQTRGPFFRARCFAA